MAKKKSVKRKTSSVKSIKNKLKSMGFTMPHGYEVRRCKRCKHTGNKSLFKF